LPYITQHFQSGHARSKIFSNTPSKRLIGVCEGDDEAGGGVFRDVPHGGVQHNRQHVQIADHLRKNGTPGDVA
jgi:hypothetical protein